MKKKRFLLSASLGAAIFFLSACRQKPIKLPAVLNEVVGEKIVLEATPQAEKAGVENVSGEAIVDVFGGEAQVKVSLPDGVDLPEGAVFEAWLVDVGPSGADEASVAGRDWPARARYYLSLGVLTSDNGKWRLRAKYAGEFTPYDLVAVTLEPDGSTENYDPRPATPVLIGKIRGEALEDLK
jgi:hypothetical protein